MDRDYGREIAYMGLGIKAIKLNTDDPSEWASGFRMPIYNDNRMFLFHPGYRRLITDGFQQLIMERDILYDVIAGTFTAGISPGTSLADRLNCPFIYVRDKPKDHGLRNRIEGIDAEKDLRGMRVIVIEDLISTGGSSASAVQAVRDANGKCNYCLSIFNYGFDKAQRIFHGEEPFDKEENRLEYPCEVRSLLTYDILLEVAKKTGYLTEERIVLLEEWRADPFNWEEKHGFPKIERSND